MLRSLLTLLALLLCTIIPLRADGDVVTVTNTDELGRVARIDLTIDDATHDVTTAEGTDYAGTFYVCTLTCVPLNESWGDGPVMKFFSHNGAWYYVWFGDDGAFTGAIRYGGPGYSKTSWLYRAEIKSPTESPNNTPTPLPDHR